MSKFNDRLASYSPDTPDRILAFCNCLYYIILEVSIPLAASFLSAYLEVYHEYRSGLFLISGHLNPQRQISTIS